MPTPVSFPRSHAFRPKANGTPGEGQLCNTALRRWEIRDISEQEQLMGYPVGITAGVLATLPQRSSRLGQALTDNTNSQKILRNIYKISSPKSERDF